MKTKPRMTLSEDKYYSLQAVRKFLGLGPSTNISHAGYPNLEAVRGWGYRGSDIVDEISSRNGSTRIVAEWFDRAVNGHRAEIAYR